ncbi:MAG: folylpolyglutamate synthase/dihydrofolate synthase family protein [Chloroflexota bacterium]
MQADSAIHHAGYHEALDWLYSLSPNIRTAAEIVADHPRKLARTRALLQEIGNPDLLMSSVLVAGTKGKGSIAAYTEAMLRAAGYRTGLVTSPHLVSWCERTRVDGRDVDPESVARLLPDIRRAIERLEARRPDLGHVTTFEAGFAFALQAFSERGVQVAVVEAGVGGLHDATNVLEPLAVALGPISYDHMATLGHTLTAIATEKTGIFRSGRLAVSAHQSPEAFAVVQQQAAQTGARLEVIGDAWQWRPDDPLSACGAFSIAGPRGHFQRLETPLLGRHQRENAAAAVALTTGVLDVLPPGTAAASSSATRRGVTGRVAVASTIGPTGAVRDAVAVDGLVRAGLKTVRWPGRLQVLQKRPWLVVDGAHNGDSAVRLAEAMSDCFPAGRRSLILGTSVGKDVARILDALLPIASSVTLTRSHHERSVPLDALAKTVAGRGVPAQIVPEVRDAIAQTLAQAASSDVILVTGSLFVVGEALELSWDGERT